MSDGDKSNGRIRQKSPTTPPKTNVEAEDTPERKRRNIDKPPKFWFKMLNSDAGAAVLVPDAALPDARAAALLAFSCVPLLHPRFDGISRDGRGFKIFRQQLSQDIVSVFDIICVPRSKLCLFLFAATKYLQKHSSQCCTA